MSCPEKSNYILDPHSTSALECLRESALQEIEYCFGSAQITGNQDILTLRRKTDNREITTIPENVKIHVLERELANQVFDPLDRGRYYRRSDKIILNPEKWCKKTVIHECLHSVSIFNHPCNSSFFRKTLYFAEGATEFLTGLLLFGNHYACYKNWIKKKYKKVCGLSYPHEIKIIFAFCGCVDPQVLVDLYLGNRTNVFPNAWAYFTEDIIQASGKNFKDVLDEGMKIGLITAFEIECEQRFQRRFRELKKSLDFSLL